MRYSKLSLSAAAAGSALLFLCVSHGAFVYSSVCIRCGDTQSATDWHIPSTNIKLWHTETVTTTPLSRVALSAGLVPTTHVHDWHFATGGGNGIRCSLGNGQHLVKATRSASSAAFVAAVARHQGLEEAQSWLVRLLDPKRTWATELAANAVPLPAAGFADAAAFDSWWRMHATNRKFMLDLQDE